MQNGTKKMPSEIEIRRAINQIPDPEIPVITIDELGIIRNVAFDENTQTAMVTITPTYSGCPAMKLIEHEISEKIKSLGITNVQVKSVLSPAWTTDWITDEAKLKLEEYGIAPPEKSSPDKSLLSPFGPKNIKCPRCKSSQVHLVSQFGSTACKAHYQCKSCKEPFDYFKCI